MGDGKVLIGHCSCPVCTYHRLDSGGVWAPFPPNSKAYRNETRGSRLLTLSCDRCESYLHGKGLWLWFISSYANFIPALDPEEIKELKTKDLNRLYIDQDKYAESKKRDLVANLRPKEDLYCPVCQRSAPESIREVTYKPMMWAHKNPPERSSRKEMLASCVRCHTSFHGKTILWEWIQAQRERYDTTPNLDVLPSP